MAEESYWNRVGGVLISGLEKKIDAEIYGTERIGDQSAYDESYTRAPQSTQIQNGTSEQSNVSVGGIQLNKTAVMIAVAALGVALFLSRK